MILEFIQTPIIASACPGMFSIFKEILFIILPYISKEKEFDISAKLGIQITEQVENLKLALGT